MKTKIGAELEIGIENRLQLEEIDWTIVEQWVKEGQERSPETKLVELVSYQKKYLRSLTEYTQRHTINNLGRNKIKYHSSLDQIISDT